MNTTTADNEAEIPWKMWASISCPSCGLDGKSRHRLVVEGSDCPRCGARQVQVGEAFVLEGSD